MYLDNCSTVKVTLENNHYTYRLGTYKKKLVEYFYKRNSQFKYYDVQTRRIIFRTEKLLHIKTSV